MSTMMPDDRIVTLDVVRGVAVMGILAMNVVGFAMPFQAYMNPAAYGSHGATDFASWAFNFIFIDGKMRGLFSFLFGASMLLVIEKANASGVDALALHFRRMFWLLLFGLAHFYLVWFGDILAGYAQIGMIAYLFHRLAPRTLVAIGIALLVLQLALMASGAWYAFHLESRAGLPGAPVELIREWEEFRRPFEIPSSQALAADLALHGGEYGPIAWQRFAHRTWEPFAGLLFFGCETLAYFLFGMALLKTGFFRGEWQPASYRRVLLAGYGIAVPVYALLAYSLYRDGFGVPMLFACVMAATVPFRPLMVVATAALIILAARKGGALATRIAAAGRAAFTNYLGASLLMTCLFYGYGAGLYGAMSRIELWIVVLPAWALMLVWSKPWLDRFRYGPLEWLWRSLANGRVEPLRRAPGS